MSQFDDILELLRRGEVDEFDAAVSRVTDESLRLWLQGSRADRLANYPEAIAKYRSALAHQPVPHRVAASAPVRLCAALSREGDVDHAVIVGEQHLLRMMTMEPYPLDDAAELKSILANIYSSRGEFLRAISLTADAPPTTETGILRAQWGWSRSVVLFQSGHVDEALECAVAAANAVDREAHPSFVVGIDSNILWMRCVRGEELSDDDIVAIERARARENSDGRHSMHDELTVGLAFALAIRGETTRAHELVTELIDGNRLTGKGLVRVATVLNALDELPQALSVYRQVLAMIDPEFDPVIIASVWRTLATRYEAIGDVTAALECLKAAVEAVGIATAPNADPLCIEF